MSSLTLSKVQEKQEDILYELKNYGYTPEIAKQELDKLQEEATAAGHNVTVTKTLAELEDLEGVDYESSYQSSEEYESSY